MLVPTPATPFLPLSTPSFPQQFCFYFPDRCVYMALYFCNIQGLQMGGSTHAMLVLHQMTLITCTALFWKSSGVYNVPRVLYSPQRLGWHHSSAIVSSAARCTAVLTRKHITVAFVSFRCVVCIWRGTCDPANMVLSEQFR